MSKIILMGDSITAHMPQGIIGTKDDEVKQYGIENVGIESYRKYCWPKIEHTDVDQYVLLIGINNIGRPDCDYDDEQTIEDVPKKLERFIKQIIAETDSKLIVQSIYPTKHLDRREKIIYVNKRLSQICTENNVDYLDLYSVLSDENGILKKEYSDDGIHPNNLGYIIIASKINQRINLQRNVNIKSVEDSELDER